MVYDSIRKLVAYGVNTGLVEPEDEIYVTNRLLEVMKLDEYEKPEVIEDDAPLEEILKDLLDEAYASGVLEDNGIGSRDLFDTKLMGCLVARPSEVIRTFMNHYQKSPVEATDFFYKFSQDTDYIRRYRICKDIRWVTKSVYGDIDTPSTFPNRRRIPKPLRQHGWQSRAAIRNVSFARKMRGMRDGWIIPPGKITGSSPSPSMAVSGASSILLMYITTSTALFSTASMYP